MINRKKAGKIFWSKIFPETFSNMNDYNKVLQMSYKGQVIDEFLNSIYDSIGSCDKCRFLDDDGECLSFSLVYPTDDFYCGNFERKEEG